MQVSQNVMKDFPDLILPSGLDVMAGLLYVPLSGEGKDFIVFLRKGQMKDVHWAGKPFKNHADEASTLEPRKSFKTWSQVIAGRCRVWKDEQLETAGVLALVYGKVCSLIIFLIGHLHLGYVCSSSTCGDKRRPRSRRRS
jgi:hypothetical protein